jgi:hypothetical protein
MMRLVAALALAMGFCVNGAVLFGVIAAKMPQPTPDVSIEAPALELRMLYFEQSARLDQAREILEKEQMDDAADPNAGP